MFCLDWNPSRNNPISTKEIFSNPEISSFSGEQDIVNVSQPSHLSIKKEHSEDDIYGQSIIRNSTIFNDWMKPLNRLSNSTSLSNIQYPTNPNNSKSSNYLSHKPCSNNAISYNKWSKHQSTYNISIDKNNSFNNQNCQSKSDNFTLSNDLKHQSNSNNVSSANNWAKYYTISNMPITKYNSSLFNNSNNNSNNFNSLNNSTSVNDSKCQRNSNSSCLSNDLRRQNFFHITSSDDWLKPQSSFNKSSYKDWLKSKTELNNSTSSNAFLKQDSHSNALNASTNLLPSESSVNISTTTNDSLKQPPSLTNATQANGWLTSLSSTDDTNLYNNCIENPGSNNSSVNNVSSMTHATVNNSSTNIDCPASQSNTFVTNNIWLEPETNSNNSVTWLMPEPNPDCEMVMIHQQLTTLKQECDTKPVLTELQPATRESIFFEDAIKLIPSPSSEYIYKNSPEELFKICGLDDLLQTTNDDIMIMDEILSDLNIIGNECKIQSNHIIKEEPMINDEPANPVITNESINNIKSFNRTLNRKYFKCPQCIYNTNTKEHLDEHINKIHSSFNIIQLNMHSGNRSKSRYGKMSADNNYMQESIVSPKPRGYLYKCSKCKYKTRRIDRYQKHIEEKTCTESSDIDDMQSKTPKISNNKVGRVHSQTKRSLSGNSKPKSNKCPQCSYSSNRSDCLQKHMEKVHSKTICYKCNSCTFQSTLTKEYYEHMKRHYAGPPFVCDSCYYKSKLITAFVAHRVIHTGDRLFCCTMCSFSCKRKYHLKGHMISHSREKNFTCKFCFKKYSYKCSLVRHLKTACRAYAPVS